jgi:MFS family permease
VSGNSNRWLVRRYYLYMGTVSTGFITPIFTLFLLFRELTYTDIATLSMVYAVLTVIGEIPTGYVGDRIGRRDSLVVSSVMMVASILGFVVVGSYAGLLLLYVLWALALVFRSGSGDAWLYDTLESSLQAERFTHVRGRGVAVQRAVTVIAMLAGAWLYSLDPRLPFVASGLLNVASIPVLLTLPRNRQFGPDGSADRLRIRESVSVIVEALRQPAVGVVVLLVAVFIGAAGATNTYIQPIAVGPLAFPEASLGLLYAGFTAVASIGAAGAGWIEHRLGERTVLVVAPIGLGAILLLPILAPLLALPAFVLMRGGRPLVESLASGYLNRHTGSVGRATVLSAASMAYAGAKLPFYLLGGVVADAISPVVAVGALGLAALGAGGAILVTSRLAR